MKVLMFGWEFPPHISGGLGTACFGLTQALARENTEILFVIPKADIQTTTDGVSVISASDIILPEQSISKKQEKEPGGSVRPIEPGIVTLSVKSFLSPYTSADSFESFGFSRWNYQLSDKQHAEQPAELPGKRRYRFSGSYGPGLLEEVERYAEVAAEIARQNDFDVIHAHDWLTFPAGAAVKRITGKPLLVHVHATEYDRAGENVDPKIYHIERRGMEEADQVIAVSQWTKNIITRYYSIPEEKVEVVHNGVIDKKEDQLFSAPPIGKPIVTFLGRITHQKGPEYFIEAAQKVLQRFPEIHFVMAGSGDMLGKMIERVAELRISSHFHFTGFLRGDQVDKMWSGSEVYVMPSVSEPFGITPLEAIRAGVPVIISKQSGVAEVVEHAIKVDFWDTEALANAICNILNHKALARTLKRRSLGELREITWTRAAEKINKLYDELTTQNPLPEFVFSDTSTQAVGAV